MILLRPLAAALLFAPFAIGQAATITEERVRETVSWLAADERAGRDTGSPELVAVGEWIADRFAKAGLAQVQEGTWMHQFPLTGWQLDSTTLLVKLVRSGKDEDGKEGKDGKRTIVLLPDVDVRQWTVADAVAGDDETCTVALLDDPVLQRLLLAGSARRPILCEVAEDHPYWQQAKGTHRVMGQKRQASRPLLLVRKGLLPKAAAEGGDVTWTATWSVGAPERTEVPQCNVMGLWRGTTKKDEYVLVSAHYDHLGIGREVDGDRIYNGADDDATGTTAVLLLAEALAKEAPTARSVLFVCFTGEEKGLLGSRAFANQPPVPLDKIVANLNLEMIGRPEPGNEGKAWITGADLSDFAAISAAALKNSGIEVIEFPMASRLFAQSDNWSLAQKGVVAHSLSAGSLHKDYHQPSDEVAKLDIPHMTRIVRGLLGVVVELANREQAPQWNDKGKERMQRKGR